MTRFTRRDVLRLTASAALAGSLAVPQLARGATRRAVSFDDGSSKVPRGLVGDPTRVIVVGAGWAGLTIANALRTAGIDYVLLEARDRIGGRAHTVDIGGYPIDLGCSWIHGPIGNPMTTWAQHVGVGFNNGDVELDYPIIRFFDEVIGAEVSLADKMIPVGYFLNFEENASTSIANQHGPGLSVEQGWQLYADRQSMTPDQERRAGFMARGFTEMVYGKPWSQLSLADWAPGNSENKYLGVGEGNFPRGAYRLLYGAMADGGDEELHLRCHVRSIESHRTGVTVRATQGGHQRQFHGSHVVCAVPLGVLKTGGVHISPMPAAKTDAIRHTGFGNIEKVVMVFAKPFWHDLTHTHILHYSKADDLAFPWWIDMQRTHGIPALVAFNGGPYARALHNITAEQRLFLALRQLSTIFGYQVPKPIDWRATDWRGEEFTQGSYTAMLVGRTVNDLSTIAAPINGRILFAGESTNRARHSTADGAMSSGIREAKRLLRKPAVLLR